MNDLLTIARVCLDYWFASARQNSTTFVVIAVGLFVVATISMPPTAWQVTVNALVALPFAGLIAYGATASACVAWIHMSARSAGLSLRAYVGTGAYRDALSAYVRESAIKWW